MAVVTLLAWLAAVLTAPSPLPDLTHTACGRGQEALHRTAASQEKAVNDQVQNQSQERWRVTSLRLLS
jgi:hypothetical protein